MAELLDYIMCSDCHKDRGRPCDCECHEEKPQRVMANLQAQLQAAQEERDRLREAFRASEFAGGPGYSWADMAARTRAAERGAKAKGALLENIVRQLEILRDCPRQWDAQPWVILKLIARDMAEKEAPE